MPLSANGLLTPSQTLAPFPKYLAQSKLSGRRIRQQRVGKTYKEGAKTPYPILPLTETSKWVGSVGRSAIVGLTWVRFL